MKALLSLFDRKQAQESQGYHILQIEGRYRSTHTDTPHLTAITQTHLKLASPSPTHGLTILQHAVCHNKQQLSGHQQ